LVIGLRRTPPRNDVARTPAAAFVRSTVRSVIGVFRASFWAQAALAPILLAHFHRFSWAGLVTNALGVPLAGAGMGLGAALFAADRLPVLSGAPARGLAWATDAVLRALIGLARWGASLPFAEIPRALTGPGLALFSFATVGVFWTLSTRSRRAGWMTGLFILAVLAVVFGAVRPTSTARALWAGTGRSAVVLAVDPGGSVTVLGGGTGFTAKEITRWALREGLRVDRLILPTGSVDPAWVDDLRPRDVRRIESMTPGETGGDGGSGWRWTVRSFMERGSALRFTSRGLTFLWIDRLAPRRLRSGVGEIDWGPVDVMNVPVGADRKSRNVLFRSFAPRWVVVQRAAHGARDAPLETGALRRIGDEGPLELRLTDGRPTLIAADRDRRRGN
jgi:hypothetical protein